MKKNDIKKIAKLYAGSLVENAIGCGADSEFMTSEDMEQLQNEMNAIARRISKTEGYIGMGELDQIILSVIKQ